MQSKKRFREIFLWDADWFMRLDDSEKLFWYYINDHCDNIGVWEPNMHLAEFHIGSGIDIDQFHYRVNKGKVRLIKAPDGSLFLPRFVKFQYCKNSPLNPNSPSHKSYLKLMVERGLLEWFSKNFPDVIPEDLSALEPLETPKRALLEPSKSYKDMDQYKDRDTEEDTSLLSIKKGYSLSEPSINGEEDSE